MADLIEITQVEGLADFSRALGKIDRDLAKTLRTVLNDAADPVADTARRRVEHKTGAAARSIKTSSTRTESRVKGGGNRAPYYPWLDFGGGVGRRKRTRRPFKKTGRYIFAVYGEMRDSGEFTAMLDEGLKDMGRRAGIAIETGDG